MSASKNARDLTFYIFTVAMNTAATLIHLNILIASGGSDRKLALCGNATALLIFLCFLYGKLKELFQVYEGVSHAKLP